MKLMYRIILTIAFLFIVKQSTASHMAGADITYKSLGKGKFLITGKMYRDCRGIPISGTNGFKIFCADKNIGTYSLSMKRKAINNLSANCSKTSVTCSPQNTYGTGKGIEEHVFETTIDFNRLPFKNFVTKGGCEIIISFSECCRNSAITTGINGPLYTYAMLNICNFDLTKEKQSSPTFTSKPFIFTCCNQPYVYNPGLIDTLDYDSFSFEMDDPLKAWKTTVSYSSPLHKNKPVTTYCPNGTCNTPNPNYKNGGKHAPTGFYLDNESGEMIFMPIKCNEVSVIAMKITEWRKDKNGKMKIVGITRRDIQMWVSSCPNNNPPIITAKYDNTVYVGDTLTITINAKDLPFKPTQTKGDTVKLTWNKAIKGATFKVKADTNGRDQIGTFEWIPKKGDLQTRPYTFTVLAQDDNCPIRAQQIKEFIIKVKDTPLNLFAADQISCGILKLKTELKTPKTGTTYTWIIRDSNMNIIDSSKKDIDTLSLNYIGKISVILTVNNSNLTVPFTINKSLSMTSKVNKVILNDIRICKGNTIRIKPSPLFLASPLLYKWYVNGQYKSKADSLVFVSNNDSNVSLIIKDSLGCILNDTAKVSYIKQPKVEMDNIYELCEYKLGGYGPKWNRDHTYLWLHDSSTQRSILFNKAGLHIVKVTDKGTKCSILDSFTVKMKKAPVFNLKKEAWVCAGKNLEIGVPNNTYYTYYWSTTGEKTNKIIVKTPRNYSLTVTDNLTKCYLHKSVKFRNYPTPIVDLGPNKGKCFGDSVTIESKFYKSYTYKWNDINTNTHSRRIVKPKTYYLMVIDTNKCKNSDSIKINQQKRVVVNAGNDTAFCFGGSIELNVDYNSDNKYLWQPMNVKTNKTKVTQSGTYYITVTNYLNCKGEDTVVVKMNDEIKITRPNQQNIKRGATIKLNGTATPNLSGNKYTWEDLITKKVAKGNSITVSPNTSRSYKFTATIKQNGLACSRSSQTYILVDTTSSIQSYLLNSKLQVFPNPVKSNESIIIKLDDINASKTVIKIYDINGKRVPVIITHQKNTFTIQPLNRTGEFIIEIENKGLKAFRKIIVNN